MFDVTIFRPQPPCLLYSAGKRRFPSLIRRRSPDTIHASEVDAVMALTELESSMIERTVAELNLPPQQVQQQGRRLQ